MRGAAVVGRLSGVTTGVTVPSRRLTAGFLWSCFGKSVSGALYRRKMRSTEADKQFGETIAGHLLRIRQYLGHATNG